MILVAIPRCIERARSSNHVYLQDSAECAEMVGWGIAKCKADGRPSSKLGQAAARLTRSSGRIKDDAVRCSNQRLRLRWIPCVSSANQLQSWHMATDFSAAEPTGAAPEDDDGSTRLVFDSKPGGRALWRRR